MSQKISPDQIELEKVAAAESLKSFYVFFRNFWSVLSAEDYVDNWHVQYLCDELERVGKIIALWEEPQEDLIINVPPGTSKSSIVSQAWPAWMATIMPHVVVIKTSYSKGLSRDNNIKTKMILQSEKWRRWYDPYFIAVHGKPLSFTKDIEEDFRTNFGGIHLASSTGGTVTGKHAHIIIQDDPLSAEGAESEATRKGANRFQDRTLASRKIDKKKTVTITVMQRLHQEDPTGHKLAKESASIKHICLPAELSKRVKPAFLRKFYTDGLLDVHRLDREVIQKMRTDLGSYAYAGQFGQDPVPEGGGKIKESWFVFCDETEVPNDVVWDVWIDGAYTEKTKNDPTGLIVCGFSKKFNKLYVLSAMSKYMGINTLIDYIKDTCKRLPISQASMIYVEPMASGYSIIQMLTTQTKLNATKITGPLIGEGKNARISVSAPKCESSQVVLIKGNWNTEFIEQQTGFPKAIHDEYVDLLGYAVNHYFRVRSSKGVKRKN